MIGAAGAHGFDIYSSAHGPGTGRGSRLKSFSTGSWTTAARTLGGPLLGLAVVAGGVICGVGMFNALAMSYARLPIAMSADGLLPRIFQRRNHRGVPWVSLLACGLAWALALKLPFERLISVDLILYGSSLLLEFVALIVLRIREPELPATVPSRKFRLRLSALRRPLQRFSLRTPSTPLAMNGSSARPPH